MKYCNNINENIISNIINVINVCSNIINSNVYYYV